MQVVRVRKKDAEEVEEGADGSEFFGVGEIVEEHSCSMLFQMVLPQLCLSPKALFLLAKIASKGKAILASPVLAIQEPWTEQKIRAIC